MSRLYGERHRALQDEFGTRALADRIESLATVTEFDEAATGFIASSDMFFLATVGERGRPAVSHKGGEPGFARVLGATTLACPGYDGNGVFLSMGNVARNAQVGLLFIAFERPHRLRLQGTASVRRDDPLMAGFPEADFVVRVTLSEPRRSCPRYIHRHQRGERSRYVPCGGVPTPVAGCKRMAALADVLPERDRGPVAAAAPLSMEAWMHEVGEGDPEA